MIRQPLPRPERLRRHAPPPPSLHAAAPPTTDTPPVFGVLAYKVEQTTLTYTHHTALILHNLCFLQVKEALRRRQSIVRISVHISLVEFQVISLLGTKTTRKGRTTFSVHNLDDLEILLGKDWYYYRKNEVDVSTIHRDSFQFFLYKHRDIVEYASHTCGHTSLVFSFVKIDKKI